MYFELFSPRDDIVILNPIIPLKLILLVHFYRPIFYLKIPLVGDRGIVRLESSTSIPFTCLLGLNCRLLLLLGVVYDMSLLFIFFVLTWYKLCGYSIYHYAASLCLNFQKLFSFLVYCYFFPFCPFLFFEYYFFVYTFAYMIGFFIRIPHQIRNLTFL